MQRIGFKRGNPHADRNQMECDSRASGYPAQKYRRKAANNLGIGR